MKGEGSRAKGQRKRILSNERQQKQATPAFVAFMFSNTKPSRPSLDPGYFHTPDAIAMMTVDHKIAHKVESGHVEVTVAIFSCVTARMPPPTAGSRAHTHAGIHIKHTCLATLLLPLPRRYPAKSLANISIKENVRTVWFDLIHGSRSLPSM